MSKKQTINQYSKFYHNDFKKLLGIDQTRTASQKLLDKVIKIDKRSDFYQTENHPSAQVNSEPKKKVKIDASRNQKLLSNKQILQNKLFKSIQNQQNISKLLKSLAILKKCLNQESFLSDPQINFASTWQIYKNKLEQEIIERNYCSVESFNIMSNIADCIEILLTKFCSNTQKLNQKQSLSKDILDSQQSSENQAYLWFARLFTDDSFLFNKNLANIKSFLFNSLDPQPQFQSSSNNKSFVFTLITKLVMMPIKFQWAYSSLVNLFKQFNNRGLQNEFSSDAEKKTYLKNFNDMLNRKPKSAVIESSYNIMGRTKDSFGLKTVSLQIKQQSGSDKWVSKQ